MLDRLYKQKKDLTFWKEYSFFAGENCSNRSIVEFLNNRYPEYIEKLKNGPKINHDSETKSQPMHTEAPKHEETVPKTDLFNDSVALIKGAIGTAIESAVDTKREKSFDQECDKYLGIFKKSIKVAFYLELIAAVVLGIAFFEDGEGLFIIAGGVVAAIGGKILSTLLLHFLTNVNKIRKNTEKLLEQKQD